MSNDVRFIDITFENIDNIIIPSHYFAAFELDDICTKVCRAAMNAILRYSVANSVKFELNPEANRDADTFGGDVYYTDEGEDKLFRRLQYDDITSLKLIFSDGTFEELRVPWEDEENNEYRNKLQSSFLNEAGQLCVQIAKNKE